MIIDISVRLRALRLQKRLRQDQVARLVGVEKSSISMYENDMRRPSYETLVRFANLYGVTTDYLLGRTDTTSVDVSGLTATEIELIKSIIASMTTKNKKLEELQQ